jgi:hypothetical protein
MSHQLTPTGGRSSGEEENTSSMSTTRRLLMFIRTRILKDKRSLSGKDIMAGTKDGELSMLTNKVKKKHLDMMDHLDSTSTDHSISDQDSQ